VDAASLVTDACIYFGRSIFGSGFKLRQVNQPTISFRLSGTAATYPQAIKPEFISSDRPACSAYDGKSPGSPNLVHYP
jgi:hypothetical protein